MLSYEKKIVIWDNSWGKCLGEGICLGEMLGGGRIVGSPKINSHLLKRHKCLLYRVQYGFHQHFNMISILHGM